MLEHATRASTQLRLGQTDICISQVGVGAWQWGDRLYWGYGQTYSEADAYAAYKASLTSGLTLFDTAEIYGFGKSERLLAYFASEAAKSRGLSSGTNPVIATKFFPYPWRWRSSSLVQALRASLSRLNLNQVDLYQVHFPRPFRSVETWAHALADAVDAGLTKAVGVSNYNREQVMRTQDALGKRGVILASNQIPFSLLNRHHEYAGTLSACADLGVSIIAYSPLAQGLLTGKYSLRDKPPWQRRLRGGEVKIKRAASMLSLMRDIGEEHGGKTPAQVALNWAIAKGTVPIPGAKTAAQASENAGAMGWDLADSQVQKLDEASDQSLLS